MMHQYYHIPGVTDLQKMQAEANDIAMATGLHSRDEPSSSIIHHHAHGVDCKDHHHQYYRPNSGLLNEDV